MLFLCVISFCSVAVATEAGSINTAAPNIWGFCLLIVTNNAAAAAAVEHNAQYLIELKEEKEK